MKKHRLVNERIEIIPQKNIPTDKSSLSFKGSKIPLTLWNHHLCCLNPTNVSFTFRQTLFKNITQFCQFRAHNIPHGFDQELLIKNAKEAKVWHILRHTAIINLLQCRSGQLPYSRMASSHHTRAGVIHCLSIFAQSKLMGQDMSRAVLAY